MVPYRFSGILIILPFTGISHFIDNRIDPFITLPYLLVVEIIGFIRLPESKQARLRIFSFQGFIHQFLFRIKYSDVTQID